MKKKILSIMIVIMLILSTVNFANAEPSSWALEEVDEAIELSLVPRNLTNYQDPITREEFTSLIVRAYEKLKEEEIKGTKSFSDTKDKNVEKVAYLGIVNGVGNGKFMPKENLTREQAAVILLNLADKAGDPLIQGTYIYDDNTQISDWANEAIKKAKSNGIMNGVGNYKFNPKGTYTIEQSIATVLRLYTRIENRKVTEEGVQKAIMAMKKEYPEGMSWTNDNFYKWNGRGGYSGGGGCAGFAFLLSDVGFGERLATESTDISNLKIGDILRVDNDGHSVIVIDIKGETVTFAEGNYNSSIHWGRTMSLSEVERRADYILTRY